MRHKYATSAIVLARTPLAEASTLLYLLTHDFGLVKARAQGVRKPGAKLASATQTLTEHDAMLVRGKEGWRLSGAVCTQDWFSQLPTHARERSGRVAGLLLRLVHGESNDPTLLSVFREFIEALTTLSDEDADIAEHIAVLRILGILGLDSAADGEGNGYGTDMLGAARENKRALVMRINRGIAASGL